MLHRYTIKQAKDGYNYMVFESEEALECYRNANMNTVGHMLISCVGGYFNALNMNKKHGGAS